jgi:hypothetical protein
MPRTRTAPIDAPPAERPAELNPAGDTDTERGIGGPTDQCEQCDGEQNKRTFHETPPWRVGPALADILNFEILPGERDSRYSRSVE